MTGDATGPAGSEQPRLVSYLQVVAQLAGMALCVWPWPGAAPGPWPALLPCLAGAALGVYTLAHNRIGNFSIFPEPKAGAALITSGPYAHVRHPMYGALMLMMLGIGLWHAQWPNGVGLALVVAAVTTKAIREERFLCRRFPAYPAYRAVTRRFVPFVL